MSGLSLKPAHLFGLATLDHLIFSVDIVKHPCKRRLTVVVAQPQLDQNVDPGGVRVFLKGLPRQYIAQPRRDPDRNNRAGPAGLCQIIKAGGFIQKIQISADIDIINASLQAGLQKPGGLLVKAHDYQRHSVQRRHSFRCGNIDHLPGCAMASLQYRLAGLLLAAPGKHQPVFERRCQNASNGQTNLPVATDDQYLLGWRCWVGFHRLFSTWAG